MLSFQRQINSKKKKRTAHIWIEKGAALAPKVCLNNHSTEVAWFSSEKTKSSQPAKAGLENSIDRWWISISKQMKNWLECDGRWIAPSSERIYLDVIGLCPAPEDLQTVPKMHPNPQKRTTHCAAVYWNQKEELYAAWNDLLEWYLEKMNVTQRNRIISPKGPFCDYGIGLL